MCRPLSPKEPLSWIENLVPTRKTAPFRAATPLPLSSRKLGAPTKSSTAENCGCGVPTSKIGTAVAKK